MRNKFKKFLIITLTAVLCLFSTVSCNITLKPKTASLEFTLTQSDVDNYVASAYQAELNLPSTSSVIAANKYINSLVNGIQFINEQFSIAQINYFADMTVTKTKEDYNFAISAANTARTSYKNALKAVWNSSSTLKSSIFYGMTDDEVNALFNAPSEVSALEMEIDLLTSQYLALSSTELQEKTGPIYSQIVTKYNQIATLTNFDNYYNYASKYVYERDYQPSQLSSMTGYIKTYIIPLYTRLYNEFYTAYNNLNAQDLQLASNLVSSPFNNLSTNYVSDYISTLNTTSKKGMSNLFDANNYMLATSNNAYNGAYTVTFNYSDTSYCYFGPSYQDMFTVVHELGHYAANYVSNNANIPLDIAEIHSQANELMFLIYLSNKVDSSAYKVVALNSVLDTLRACIVSNLMNEFEMKVFNRNVENYTSDDFDAIMTEVINEFGATFLNNVFGVDLYNYWKRAIIQQPCYYVSYAVSGISALCLYAEASKNDASYQNALTKYDNLLKANFDDGLTATLNSVNISNPFNEETFKTLQALSI